MNLSLYSPTRPSTGELTLPPAAPALRRCFVPRRQVHRRSRSRVRSAGDSALLWLVRRTRSNYLPPPTNDTHTIEPLTRARLARLLRVTVRRRECVLDVCRDATHVYP